MATELYARRLTCRLCTGRRLEAALAMEPIPIGDGYVRAAHRNEAVETIPLEIEVCADCGQVQTSVDVNQRTIYADYLWTTSVSPGLAVSYEKYADEVVKRFFALRSWFAVELGSNDGTFSRHLQARGGRVLGVEPAGRLAALARELGVETRAAFFTRELAEQIAAERGQADLIVANHMFANVTEPREILRAVDALLKDDGILVIQVFYLYDVVKSALLENFNHEHPSYFCVRSLHRFFERSGFELFDVEHVQTKGGSLRCFVQRRGGRHEVKQSVREFEREEEAVGLPNDLTAYQGLRSHIAATRANFAEVLTRLKVNGKTVAGYGTSIGATVFIYQYGLGGSLSFLVDDDPARHGLVSPGYHIPVAAPEALYELKPALVVVLAPLYADRIIDQHRRYLERGGEFLVFRPEFRRITGLEVHRSADLGGAGV